MNIPSKPRSALREFLGSGAAGGLVLMAAAALALIAANSPLSASYFTMIGAHLGPLSVVEWINDALMALFFLLVGLEIKREMVDGHLATWADRRLPVVAALAGMVLPALIYLGVAPHQPRGWAIPAATDIAFAIAILALLGPRVPASLKLFLTTIAIVDDMGAVAIIAIAYTAAISGPALLAAIIALLALMVMNRAGLRHPAWYFAGILLLWFAVLLSGIHPTVAGVLGALTVPVRITPAAPDARDSTLHRMEHLLQKPVAWLVVPLFGFANAGVSFSGADPLAPVSMAIALGLFLGKQIGILGSVWIAVKLKFATPPKGANWVQIYGVALLCGIGFTMSLFIGGLAFGDSAPVKLGVLAGSLISAGTGYVVLRSQGLGKSRE